MSDTEELEYFKNYLDMFDSPGWKQFVQDYMGAKEDMQETALYQVKNMDELLVMKSRLGFCDQIINFEQQIRNEYETRFNETETNIH